MRLLWLFAYGSLFCALCVAYGFVLRDAYGSEPPVGAAAYGLLDAGAGEAVFFERPPKSDAFLVSRSPESFSLSDFFKPKGMIVTELGSGLKVRGSCLSLDKGERVEAVRGEVVDQGTAVGMIAQNMWRQGRPLSHDRA